MDLERETLSAMMTLRMGQSRSTGAIAYYVLPGSRLEDLDMVVFVKGLEDFDNDQALIELFGRLGAI